LLDIITDKQGITSTSMSVIAPEPRVLTDPGEPPPVTFTLDSTLREIIDYMYVLSQDLVDHPPRIILLYADRVQINWQQASVTTGEPPDEVTTALATGAEQSVIDIAFSVRPSAPATITLTPHAPY